VQQPVGDIERLDCVGTRRLRCVIEDIPHYAQYVTPPLLRRQVALDSVGVEQQTDFVAIPNGGECQNTGELRSKIAFTARAGSEIPRGADVHEQKNRELTLLGELLYERPAGPGRDIPIDGAHLVARAVLTHLIEIHSATFEYRMIRAGQTVVDHAARADLELAHAAHNGLVRRGGISRHRQGTGKEFRILSMTFSEEIFSASAS